MPSKSWSSVIVITLALIAFAAIAVSANWGGFRYRQPAAPDETARDQAAADAAAEPRPMTTPLNAITTFDAALISRYVVALPPPFNADQLTVADVDGSGFISSFDSTRVANFVVNNGAAGSTGTTVPPGLLMGDVSGVGSHYDGMPGTVPVSLPTMNAGGTAVVPVTVGDLTDLGVVSYDFQVTFDPTVLQPMSQPVSTTGTLCGSCVVIRNANNPGHLIISAYSFNGLTGSGTLLNLRFNVVGTPGQSTALTFENYTDSGSRIHQSFLFNEGTPSVGTMTNGSVTLVAFTPTPTFTPTNTWTPTNTPTSSPTLTATGTPTPAPVLLYNQLGGGVSVGGINSQDYEPDLDGIDSWAADDFVIPAGQTWIIQQLEVLGAYYNGSGPAESFNIQFFHDTGGFPGIPVAGGSFTELPFSANGSQFTTALPTSVILNGGTYWMSVQARMDGPTAQWAWKDRFIESNSPAIWQNPNGGFNVPACYEWGRRAATCGIDPKASDQIFGIYGIDGTGGNVTPLPTYTPTSTPTASSTATAAPTPTCNSPLIQGFPFAGGMPPPGWVKINHSEPLGQGSWHIGSAGTFASQAGDPSDYAAVNFQSGNELSTLSNWLITPVLTLREGTSITFWTRTGHLFKPDRLQVRMSTNGASTDVGTTATDVGDFTTLLLDINPTYNLSGYPFRWTKFTGTVTGVPSPVAGRFAFRYFVENGGPAGVNSNYIGIDTVSVDSCDVPPPSPTPTYNPNAVPVSLPAVSASPGSELTLPITVGDLTGLGVLAFDLQVSFDPAIVTLASPAFDTVGTLSAQMNVNTNTDFPGHLIISAFRTGGTISGSGTLINLKFTVVGNPGESTPVVFEGYLSPNNQYHVGFQLNEGKPNSTTTNGSVTIFGTALSGTVTYGNAIAFPYPRFISNVTMTGAGSPTVTATTRAPGLTVGQYWLSGFGAGPYVVTPAKSGGINGAVSSYDAALISQHVSGPPNPQLNFTQRSVADVSGNGAVTSFDAGMVAKFVAGPPYEAPGTGSTASWKFDPTMRNYVSVTASLGGQDFAGLLMGEVSGNWLNAAARPADHGNELFGDDLTEIEKMVKVELPNVEASVGKGIVIPVNVAGVAGKDIISYEFELKYDPSVIQPSPDTVELAGTVSGGLSVVTNAHEPGILRVVVYGAMPINEDGVLLNLRFTAIGKPGSVSPLSFERIMFNEGEPRLTFTDGQIELF